MKDLSRQRKVLLSVLLAIVLALSVGAAFLAAPDVKAEATLSDAEFAPVYLMGTELEIPEGKLTYGGEEKAAEARIRFPGGTWYALDRAVLSEEGKYVVEYSAKFGDVNASATREFNAVKSLYEVSGSSTAEYGTHPDAPNTEGIVVSLANGDVFRYNKPIDFTGAVKDDNILSFFHTVSTPGEADARQLIVTFTDIYDEENYITVVFQAADVVEQGYDDWVLLNTYVRAGAAFQPLSGWEGSKLHKGDKWGCSVPVGMYGRTNGNVAVGEEVQYLSFDYDARKVYASVRKTEVIDLDDTAVFSEGWTGFSSGKAYMTITAAQYNKSRMNFVITGVCNDDLSGGQYVMDETAPEITIDYGINEGAVPNALVGTPYRVFDYSVYDETDGAPASGVRVFRNYYGSSKSEVDMQNGAFVPAFGGTYYIEYRAEDYSGNESIAVVEVTAARKEQPLALEFVGEYETVCEAGARIKLADWEALGNFGAVTAVISATLDGRDITYTADEEGYIRPEYAGEYIVEYEYSDYVEAKTQSYTLTVTNGTKPAVIGEARLPRYMIKGCAYTLPALEGYGYTTGSPVEQAVFITSSDPSAVIDGFRFTPMQPGDITVSYNVRDGAYDADPITYSVKVVDVGYGGNLDFRNYFYSENASAVLTENHIAFSASEDAEIEYINPVISDFSFEFNVDGARNHFEAVDVYITDLYDSSVALKLSFERGADLSQQCRFRLNDGAETVAASGSFFGLGQSNFTASFTDSSRALIVGDNNPVIVTHTLAGTPFEGFPSRLVTVRIVMRGVAGSSALQWINLNLQTFTNQITRDIVRPQLVLVGDIVKEFMIDSEVTLQKAVAADVLDPAVAASMTVTAPDGSILIANGGTFLDGVDPSGDYTVKLTQYGVYDVTIRAEDSSGRIQTFNYVINVVDMEPPVLHVEGSLPVEAQIGDTILLPAVRAEDNLSDELQVYCFIVKPNGAMIQFADAAFCPQSAGKYIVKYYATDSDGNTATRDFTIIVG